MPNSLKRILKFGWQRFWRAKGLSFQVVFVMIIAVFVGTVLFFSKNVGSLLVQEIQKKVDIAVYFKKNIDEESILQVREELAKLSHQIESVDYISEKEALDNFLEKHKDDELYLGALREVEDNPFLPSLNIKARNPGQYAQISSFLEESVFADLIDRINYSKNKQVIDKIFSIIADVKTVSVVFGGLLVLLVCLIIVNTIKLSIIVAKDEISTMRLVGASNWFIRGPFLIQGLLYGIFGVLIVDIMLFVGFIFFNDQLSNWFLGVDLFGYFVTKFFLILAVQILAVCLLSLFSTFLAVRKYLKV